MLLISRIKENKVKNEKDTCAIKSKIKYIKTKMKKKTESNIYGNKLTFRTYRTDTVSRILGR